MPPFQEPYYKHSGKMSLGGVLLPVIACCAIVVFISPVAALFKLLEGVFVDIGFLGFLISGFAASAVVCKAIKLAAITNERFSYWFGIFTGVVFVLSSWVWFYLIFLYQGNVSPLTHVAGLFDAPMETLESIFKALKTFANSQAKTTQIGLLAFLTAIYTRMLVVIVEVPALSGAWLYGAWILETSIVVLLMGDYCRRAAGSHGYVFCDTCQQETAILYKSPLLRAMPAKDSPALTRFREKLEKGDFSVLENISVAKNVTSSGEFSRLILRGCENCHDFYCADIARVAVKQEVDFDLDLDTDVTDDEDDLVVEHLFLPATWFERLSNHFRQKENPSRSNTV